MKKENAKIKSVLLDTNVCIDLLTNRLLEPNIKKRLFEIFMLKKLKVYIPAFSIDTIFYILNSSMKIDKITSKKAILTLLTHTKLLHTNDKAIKDAFTSDFSDFEDGLINSLAETSNIDAIITSNIADYKTSNLPIFRPIDFIAQSY